jgi:hypothetical protein
MAFDESTAVARLDLTDPSKIAMVQPALDAALAIAETYCDRFFMEADEIENIVPLNGNTLKVHRYPISSVDFIVASHHAGSIGQYHVNKKSGIIYLDSLSFNHDVNVSYKGGYATLPLDIELALWDIFTAVWNATPGAGASAGGATTSGALGALKSIETPDVGRLTFETGTSSSASASGGAGASRFLGADAINLLAPYRRIDA